jgi:hypothetical protein
MRTQTRIGIARFIIDAHQIRPQITQAHDQRLGGRAIRGFGRERMRRLHIVEAIGQIFGRNYLDGGGALSGGSKRSKAIDVPPANAFTNMRPSPATRLAATM